MPVPDPEMYLIDTGHCSRIIGGDPTILARISAVGAENVSTSIIVRGELIYMAEMSERRFENLAVIHAFLTDVRIYLIDERTTDVYGTLKAALMRHFGPKERAKRRHTTLADLGFYENDMWIAATAIRHALTVVSADSDFQRMRDVLEFGFESW